MAMKTTTTSNSFGSKQVKAATNASAVRTNTAKPDPGTTNTINKASVNNPKTSPAMSMSAGKTSATTTGKTKTSNPKTEFAQEMVTLDDVALISDILSSQKNLIKMYGSALCEVSCENLRKVVNKQMSECANDQFDAFLYMNERNQYPTEPAPAQKVVQAKQKFAQKQAKMKK